jgi:hypothetical protein
MSRNRRRSSSLEQGRKKRPGKMRSFQLAASATAALLLAGCNAGGTSTQEVRRAAIEHARQQLKLPADTPLEARAWVGQPHDGELTVCGTVSGQSGSSAVPPQRFAAATEPIEWLLFEPAHDPMVRSQPDKFREWSQLCGRGAER